MPNRALPLLAIVWCVAPPLLRAQPAPDELAESISEVRQQGASEPGPRSLPAAPIGRVSGLFWDGEFAAAVGLGLDRGLSTPLLATVRLGGGYATEPWVFHAGVTGALGGLGRLSLGGTLQVSHFDGPFADLGLAYAEGPRGLFHATLGYMVAGLRYEQALARVEAGTPRHALLLLLRVPIGMWWFMVGRDQERAEHARAVARSAEEPLPAAGQSASPAPHTMRRAELLRVRAREAAGAGELERAAELYGEAVAVHDDPHSREALADVRVRLGQLVEASGDLARALELAEPDWDGARQEALADRHMALLVRIPKLRVQAPAGGSPLTVMVDGRARPAATMGYDIPLDPGTHQVVVLRAGELLVERRVVVAEGELLRLAVPVGLDPPDESDVAPAPTSSSADTRPPTDPSPP